ncbi:raftlin-like isoform X2 [Carcharodon carcharias]|nr:raftlin-like isoform X2 [Carcharodon carcharias]XP_041041025.1 raftlin-like isoform X2 [Carcharodon carcharias]XP_041041026.1 raftlin-like isoform X2 [Carcharodon carcharias]XP_041041027.1 raftlin-like isoform X2 [Carcharodon carcharias]
MGCGLPKLEKPDENSPGKIYSTLKRPQVETKVGIAYQYKLLDFTTAETEITNSSAVKLSSLHDLPTQLHELYQKGFVLAGFHSFIQSIDVEKTPEEKMFRAILIKPAVSSEENNAKTEPCSLEVELSLLSNQLPKSKGLADVLQKVQEGSRKGLRFVGLVQRQTSPADSTERHEEVSAVNSPLCQNNSVKEGRNADLNVQNNTDRDKLAQNQETEATEGEAKQKISQGEEPQSEGQASQGQAKDEEQINSQPIAELTRQEYQNDERGIQNKNTAHCETEGKVTDKQGVSSQAETFKTKAADRLQTERPAGEEQSLTATDKHNEVKQITESHEAAEMTTVLEANDTKQGGHLGQGKSEENGRKNGVENEVFLLFNKSQANQKSYKYYTTTIPLKICKKGQDINSIEANWLEHMTQHFTKGALLVDALICLGTPTDSVPKSVDGLFIFEGISEDKCESYDAIVVEQWTVINGVEVKADYVPLLNSLAAYGWQLTCVLPTPIVKRDSEGNLATKQIVFLQRPSLPHKEKKKESKKRSTKDDKPSKQDKNCLKDKNGKVTVQVKNSAGDSNEKEKQEQNVAKNGDKENAEKGISLKTEGNGKESEPAAEAVQDYICVTNAEIEKCAEVGGSAGGNTVPENIINEASGNNDICEKENGQDEQEECDNKCQNGTISKSEEEASQTKIVAPANEECVVTSQQLDSVPAAEMVAEASRETGVSITEMTESVPEEREGVIAV